jgi:hypothetical protein
MTNWPTSFRGINGKEAYERIVNAKEPEIPKINPATPVSSDDNFIYVPAINLWVAKQRTHLGKNWNECHEELGKQGYRMLILPEFIEFLKYIKTNFIEIYNEITEVRSPWRAEIFDAYFEQKEDGLYILTQNKTKAEKLDKDTLIEDKNPGIDLEDFLTKNHMRQGLPTKGVQTGDLYYWHPIEGSVARFNAYSNRASLDCNRYPSNRYSYLGVRAVRRQ